MKISGWKLHSAKQNWWEKLGFRNITLLVKFSNKVMFKLKLKYLIKLQILQKNNTSFYATNRAIKDCSFSVNLYSFDPNCSFRIFLFRIFYRSKLITNRAEEINLHNLHNLQFSITIFITRESTKKGGLNCRVLHWKRNCKDFETRCSLFDPNYI